MEYFVGGFLEIFVDADLEFRCGVGHGEIISNLNPEATDLTPNQNMRA
jgi:hypothetical protein